MNQAPYSKGGATNEPPQDEDEIITIKPDSKNTVPPVADQYINIRILYEHEHMRKLADMMRLFLESQTYADRTPVITYEPRFPDPITETERRNPDAFKDSKIKMDILILMVDEFNELDTLLESVDFHYTDEMQIIGHTEYPIAHIQVKLVEAGAQGISIGWDFKTLAKQVDALARQTKL